MPRTAKRDLLERLETLHLIILEVDAYHSAFEDLFHRVRCDRGDDPTRRRDFNRLDCFVCLTSVTITRVLDESRATVRIAIAQRRAWSRR